MKTLARITLLSVSFVALGVVDAHAQSAEQKVEGYVPPPLFGAPPAAQPRPAQPLLVPGRSSTVPVMPPVEETHPLPPVNGVVQQRPTQPGYVRPRSSRNNVDDPVKVEPYIPKFPPLAPVPMAETPRGRGEIVERPRAPLDAPLPLKKPPVPVTAALPETQGAPVPAPMAATPSAPIQTPVAAVPAPPAAPAATAAPAGTAPAVAPAPAAPVETPLAATPEPAAVAPPSAKAQPAYKVTSKGVVTGPKTMPSVPTNGVEKLETFTPGQEPAEKTLLEQHAERQQLAAAQTDAPPEAQAAKALPALPAGFVPLAKIEPVDANKSRMTLPFNPGQAELSNEQRLTVLHNIVPILAGDAGQRLMIQSYATVADKGQSSDRRIALSRALAIRAVLIDQGIEARRIDVRALGAGTDQGAADKADLILSAR